MERIICLIIGYAFGLFQTGYFVGKLNHVDIRKTGSGNSGSTNALRVLGVKAGLMTFAGDVLKCVLPILLVRQIFSGSDCLPLLAMYTGAGATLGHNYPFYLKFKGGQRDCGSGRACAFHQALDGSDPTCCIYFCGGSHPLCFRRVTSGNNYFSCRGDMFRADGGICDGAALCVRIISGDVFTDGTGMVEASCKYKEAVEWNREQNRVLLKNRDD